jgi:hypothetical protein
MGLLSTGERSRMNDTLTFGERAVGLNFNPSGDPDVDRVKRLYAEIIDMLAVNHADSEKSRLHHIAITEAQTAQMWAVKAMTWR